MNDDIVTRLRLWARNADEQGVSEVVSGLQAAADEIERLHARVEELEDTLAGRRPVL